MGYIGQNEDEWEYEQEKKRRRQRRKNSVKCPTCGKRVSKKGPISIKGDATDL